MLPQIHSTSAGFKMSWVHGVWAVLAMSVLLEVATAQGMESKHGASTLLSMVASFPGSTDQLFFARSKIKLVSRAWERGYIYGASTVRDDGMYVR